MLQARPLFDNAADATLFVAPPVWPKIVRALERRLNVMVTGARGPGKTTLLHQLQAELRERAERVTTVRYSLPAGSAQVGTRARELATVGEPLVA
jgi:Cdc6-like AAA superfamily ATPase